MPRAEVYALNERTEPDEGRGETRARKVRGVWSVEWSGAGAGVAETVHREEFVGLIETPH